MYESYHTQTYEWVISHLWASPRVDWLYCRACRRIYQFAMSHIWMSHVTKCKQYHTYEHIMPHVWASHVIHLNASCHTYECVMSQIWMS